MWNLKNKLVASEEEATQPSSVLRAGVEIASDDEAEEDCAAFVQEWQQKVAEPEDEEEEEDEPESSLETTTVAVDETLEIARERRGHLLRIMKGTKEATPQFGVPGFPRVDNSIDIDDVLLPPQRTVAVVIKKEEKKVDEAKVRTVRCVCGQVLETPQDDGTGEEASSVYDQHLRSCRVFRDTWEAAIRKLIQRYGAPRVQRLMTRVTTHDLGTDEMSLCALAESRGDVNAAVRKLAVYEYRREMYRITTIHNVHKFLAPKDSSIKGRSLLRAAALQPAHANFRF